MFFGSKFYEIDASRHQHFFESSNQLHFVISFLDHAELSLMSTSNLYEKKRERSKK